MKKSIAKRVVISSRVDANLLIRGLCRLIDDSEHMAAVQFKYISAGHDSLLWNAEEMRDYLQEMERAHELRSMLCRVH